MARASRARAAERSSGPPSASTITCLLWQDTAALTDQDMGRRAGTDTQRRELGGRHDAEAMLVLRTDWPLDQLVRQRFTVPGRPSIRETVGTLDALTRDAWTNALTQRQHQLIHDGRRRRVLGCPHLHPAPPRVHLPGRVRRSGSQHRVWLGTVGEKVIHELSADPSTAPRLINDQLDHSELRCIQDFKRG